MDTKHTLMVGLGCLALGVGACGGSADRSDKATNSKVTAAGSTINVPGDGPVDTTILIDRTTLEHDARELAGDYKEAALKIAAPTIARGGTVLVQVFGRVGGHARTIYEAQIPSLDDAGPAARDDATATAVLGAALDVAVGLEPPGDPADAKALEAITDGSGTDTARTIGFAIDALANSRAEARNILVETDGWVQQPDLMLHRLLADGDVASATTQLAKAMQPRTGRVSLLRIAGLGSTGGSNGPDGPLLQLLMDAWTPGCDALAETCLVDSHT